MDNIFVNKFRYFLLLTNISLLSVPGIKPIKLYGFNLQIFPIYFIFSNCLLFLNVVDCVVTPFYLDYPVVWNLVLKVNYIYNGYYLARRVTYFFKKKELEQIYEEYSKCLTAKLWPDILEEEINKCYKNTLKKFYFALFTMIVPLFIICTFNFAINAPPLIPSMLQASPSIEDPAGRTVHLFIGINLILTHASWIAEETYLNFLLNLFLSEFEYLQQALQKTMKVIAVNNEGEVIFENLKYNFSSGKNLINKTRWRLATWIDHHALVMSAFKKFENCFWPLIFCQFLYVTIVACGTLFIAVKGFMPPASVAMCAMHLIQQMFLICRLCRLGESITSKSTELIDVAFLNDWMGLPQDVIKILLKIGEATKRPLVLSFKQVYRVNSPTFLRVAYLQFKFFTFMQNISEGRTHHERT